MLNDELAAKSEELTTINEELLTANAELDTFLDIASHDLRSPVAAIEQLPQAMQREDPSPGPGSRLPCATWLQDAAGQLRHKGSQLIEVAQAQ